MALLTTEDVIKRGDNITLLFSSDGGFFSGGKSIRDALRSSFPALENIEVRQGIVQFTEWRMVATWNGNDEKLNSIVTNIITIIREKENLNFTFLGGETGRLIDAPTKELGLPSFNQIVTLLVFIAVIIALVLALGIFREVKGIT